MPYLPKTALLSYSSIFFLRNSLHWSVALDTEWAELNLKYQKAFPSLWEISLEMPILFFNGGFLDNWLEWYYLTDCSQHRKPANARIKNSNRIFRKVHDGLILPQKVMLNHTWLAHPFQDKNKRF